jgi:hypothetical protein
MAVVKGLQDPNQWEEMRDRLFSLWFEGVDNPEAIHLCVASWDRPAGKCGSGQAAKSRRITRRREIPCGQWRSCHGRFRCCISAQLQPQVPAWSVQEDFAASHPWFHPHRLHAHGHFAALEIPREMTRLMEAFVAD